MTKLRITGAILATAGVLVPAALLYSSASSAVHPPVTAASTDSGCLRLPNCYTPRQFRTAYGIQPLLDHGTDGRGETVVLLEIVPPPPASPPGITDIRQDLALFDSVFGLPVAHLRVVNSLADATSPWLAANEEVQDTEMAHVVAPDANLVEVLIPEAAIASATSAVTAFTSAIRLGVSQGEIISISASLGEHFWTAAEVTAMHSVLLAAQRRHVTVVAASGDTGAASDAHFGAAPVKEVSLPASDPLVLGVGGTELTANQTTGLYIGETVWNTGSSASGGGFSHLFSRPTYQNGTQGTEDARGVPDVAGDAASVGGMALVLSNGGQNYVIVATGGTSAAAPFWAGLIALADQEARRSLGFVNPAIYRIARGPSYHAAFHDITTGNNTVDIPPVTITGYQAASGWDPVTGWGTPDAQVLIPLLARYSGQ